MQAKLADKQLYWASISRKLLRLLEFQELDKKVQRIKAAKELQDGYKEVDEALLYQRLFFVLEII